MTSSDRSTDRLDVLAPFSLLRPTDAGYPSYCSDVVLRGSPDAVVRPRTEREIQEILEYAQSHRIPVTAAGGFTGLVGGAVASEGIVLATERLDRILDLGEDPETGGMTARVQPGVFLGDFQRAVAADGWIYPPDPTSRNEARLGATVATNATGEDTLLYGPTRRWVRELRVVKAGGEVVVLRRPAGHLPQEEKSTAGYYNAEHPIDLVIGSEGTLGIVSEITVDLIPRPANTLVGIAFFPDLDSGLRFVVQARSRGDVHPRALELMDRPALDLVAENPEGIVWPAGTGSAVLFKEDVGTGPDRDAAWERWFGLLREALPATPGFLDGVIAVDDAPGRSKLRSFRHRIPSRLNELLEPRREAGGGKVGTDWWVPYRHLPEFLLGWKRVIDASGLDWVVFGHAGNGHPHLNFLPRNAAEAGRARELVLAMCRDAVARGGGVAGEHGLGKLKRDLLAVQYPAHRIREMRECKTAWDPSWILGRGNLFEPEVP